jgi:peroxiredoxin
VAMLAIVVPPENMTTVARYISETKTSTPILFDSSQVAASYFNITPKNNGGFDTPHLFVIDPKGIIARSWGQGFLDGMEWQKELDQLIGAKAKK